MPGFLEDFPAESLIDLLGEDVTYVACGLAAVQIKAVVDFDIEIIGPQAFVPELQTQIEALKTDVPSPQKNDVFIYNDTTYTVDSVLSDDGIYVRVTVK